MRPIKSCPNSAWIGTASMLLGRHPGVGFDGGLLALLRGFLSGIGRHARVGAGIGAYHGGSARRSGIRRGGGRRGAGSGGSGSGRSSGGGGSDQRAISLVDGPERLVGG